MDAARVPGEIPQSVGLVRRISCGFFRSRRPVSSCVYSRIVVAREVYKNFITHSRYSLDKTC
jgi:hypothetical protein